MIILPIHIGGEERDVKTQLFLLRRLDDKLAVIIMQRLRRLGRVDIQLLRAVLVREHAHMQTLRIDAVYKHGRDLRLFRFILFFLLEQQTGSPPGYHNTGEIFFAR